MRKFDFVFLWVFLEENRCVSVSALNIEIFTVKKLAALPYSPKKELIYGVANYF